MFSVGAVFGLALGLGFSLLGSRYRVEVANMGDSGLHVPVFVKWDRYTGEAWVSAGRTGTWRKFEDVSTEINKEENQKSKLDFRPDH